MAIWNTGKKNGMWKGGRSVASNGYILIRVGVNHHLADVRGYAYEHRLVAEKKLGRKLRKGEIVHHKDGNKQNNKPKNIQVLGSIAMHQYKHRMKTSKLRRPGEKNNQVSCGCGCGATFEKYDASGRPRKYIPGHNDNPRNDQGQFI